MNKCPMFYNGRHCWQVVTQIKNKCHCITCNCIMHDGFDIVYRCIWCGKTRTFDDIMNEMEQYK